MKKFKTYRVFSEGADYIVASRTPQEAKETIKAYILDSNGELDSDECSWTVKEELEPVTIFYDEYDEKYERISISSEDLLKSVKKPEILGCNEWLI